MGGISTSQAEFEAIRVNSDEDEDSTVQLCPRNHYRTSGPAVAITEEVLREGQNTKNGTVLASVTIETAPSTSLQGEEESIDPKDVLLAQRPLALVLMITKHM